MQTILRVVIADSSEAFAGSLKDTLENCGNYSVVGISGNGEELRATLEQYRKYYETNNFEETARLLERIIRRGDENVGFYQFF